MEARTHLALSAFLEFSAGQLRACQADRLGQAKWLGAELPRQELAEQHCTSAWPPGGRGTRQGERRAVRLAAVDAAAAVTAAAAAAKPPVPPTTCAPNDAQGPQAAR